MSTMRPKLQSGFAIITAIFILVVLAALGGFIATISTAQHAGSALDIQSALAYQAARAGTEWGVDKVVNLTGGAPATACPATTLTVNGMTVTVCMQSTANDSGGLIWQVTATACSAPVGATPTCPGDATGSNYVERRLSLLVE